MKERLITLATAVAALLLVIFLLSPHRQNGQQPVSFPTTEDRGTDGLKGLFTWLHREQIAVVSFRKRYTELLRDQSLPKHGNVLIVSMPAPKEIKASEWSALSRWLEKGNSLIILGAVYYHPTWAKSEDCFCDVKKLLSQYRWTLQGQDENKNAQQPPKNETKGLGESISALRANLQGFLPQISQFSAMSGHPLLKDVATVEAQTTPQLLKNHWTLRSDNTDNLALRLLSLTDQGAIVAWQMNANTGQILLMLVPDAFSNSRLNHADNARFLNNLLNQSLTPDGRVLFDDYHFGLSELYDPEHFFKDKRLHQTIACLALFWLFYLIGYSTRLAPVRIPTPKLATLDFIEVMAGFFARRTNQRLIAEALVKHLLADIGRHRHLVSEAEVLNWLEQHSQVSPKQLSELKQALLKQRLSLIRLTNILIHIRTVTL